MRLRPTIEGSVVKRLANRASIRDDGSNQNPAPAIPAQPFSHPEMQPIELLAPAGDRDCLLAAIENGADAVYFGLHGHNARARAANFDVAQLPEIMALLHQRGVRGYVTLNTLAFPRELEEVEQLIRSAAQAGVDALIVQDIGVCRLASAIAPDLEIHASTQMSVTSAAGVRMARELGCSRVILARELSVDEIQRVRSEADLPVEVFVHGALCVAYSGQCLTSEALGARSANRGECAQACRMPYTIVCDGQDVELDNIQYLLSPQDLAAYDLVPQLLAAGVASLKIEGRLKSPEYVASITRNYRNAIDAALIGQPTPVSAENVREMALTFSRGFSHGFLDGNDHKKLVRGDYAKKRGLEVGTVLATAGRRVIVRAAVPLKPGDGLAFDAVPDANAPEQGGRLIEVSGAPPRLELLFDRRAVDLSGLVPGQKVWKTDDPALTRELRASFSGKPRRLVDLNVALTAAAGRPLRIEAVTRDGRAATAESQQPLEPARDRPAHAEALRAQFDRLGGTVYQLKQFEAAVEGNPMVPASVINDLRRRIVEQLDQRANAQTREIATHSVLPTLRPRARDESADNPSQPALIALCRNTAQALAALEAGIDTLYLDYQHIKEYAAAVTTIRQASARAQVLLAPPRIEKPGEAPIFNLLLKANPDGILVRNPGSLEFCAQRGVPFVADFSMNAANEIAVDWLKNKGAERVTASYDLSLEQLIDLARAVPRGWLEVVVHQHMPMFHMEHCVFCAFLSPGHDKTDCGRPCDDHEVLLRDRVGMEHPLVADVGCRNTLFNAVPQTAAEYLPRLLSEGLDRFRIEFLGDKPAAVGRIVQLYRASLAGERSPHALWKQLKATSRYGVTRGQLPVLA